MNTIAPWGSPVCLLSLFCSHSAGWLSVRWDETQKNLLVLLTLIFLQFNLASENADMAMKWFADGSAFLLFWCQWNLLQLSYSDKHYYSILWVYLVLHNNACPRYVVHSNLWHSLSGFYGSIVASFSRSCKWYTSVDLVLYYLLPHCAIHLFSTVFDSKIFGYRSYAIFRW